MQIAIIADDDKKELMAEFCIAYCGILSHHNLCATEVTGKYIAEATGLDIEMLMPGSGGGVDQIVSRVSYNEIDLLFYFRTSDPSVSIKESEEILLRLCDVHNIPLATNIATAEVLVMALDHGDLNWREALNPRSEYNLHKRQSHGS